MATLQKIRSRAGLLVSVVIGIALLAFILSSLLNQGGSALRRPSMNIAQIGKKYITFQNFNQEVEKLAEIYRINSGQSTLNEETIDEVREQTWQQMLRNRILNRELNKLGLTVSSEELYDMVQGKNPHPIIRNFFGDPQTGEINKTNLYRFLKAVTDGQLDENQQKIWYFYEDVMVKERASTKYNNLIKKGLYVTSMQAKNEYIERNKKVNLGYVVERFTSIPDSLISYTQKDLNQYYKEHQQEYKQEKSRDIDYVVFEIVPSDKDVKEAEKWINEKYNEFKKAEDDKQFVNYYSDIPYDDRNYKVGELPEVINDVMMNADEGFIYGPYFEDNAYKLSKLAKIDYLPDSVHARHILVPFNQVASYTAAKNLIDSLKNLLDNGEDFATLAKNYSGDGSAQDGGDLGWFTEGKMVKPFNDSCFYGKTGDVKMVESQFGFHIVEILDQSRDVKKVKVATLARELEPSTETIQKYYSAASEFAGKNNTYELFTEAANNNHDLRVLKAANIKDIDKNIPSLDNSRELVRWVYQASQSDVSPVFDMDDKFVVAALTDIHEEGIAPLKQVEAEVIINVKKAKKGEKIVEEMKEALSGVSNIDELSSKMNYELKYADNVSLASPVLRGSGFEPKVVALANTLDENELSEPIVGENGVYVVQVSEIINPEDRENYQAEKMRLANAYSSRANYEAYEALKDNTEIKDFRANFY